MEESFIRGLKRTVHAQLLKPEELTQNLI
jgi:hypothetical protein